jgi:hypothetical protein
MSFIITQVDYKSYLLDFKSLVNEEAESNLATSILGSAATPVQSGNTTLNTKPKGHYTMEFFEMCAALIIQLAR